MSSTLERSRRRVVVTGMGVVTCLGTGVDVFWRGLVEGRSGIAPLSKFDPTGLRNEKGGQVREWRFDPDAYGLDALPDEATQFLLTAAREALAQAGLVGGEFDATRAGMSLATNFGGGMSWEEHVRRRLAEQPGNHTFAESAFHTPLVHLARALGLRGPGTLLSNACASGTAAIGCALEAIRHGRADVVLAGGHDSVTPSCLAGLSILATMTRDEVRPFSGNRSGTLFGEGAAALVLEDLEHALARGAIPLAEVLGAWQTNNAYHLTAPDKGARGMTRVLAEAIADAGVSPEDIDYINAHGTGTQAHDPEETHAIKAVLGEHAQRIPVSSIKAAIAHTMGAAGACEAVATVQTLLTGIVPPTLNYDEPDPECDLDYVPNAARSAEVRCAASMSAGVGGSNACVVLACPSREPSRRSGLQSRPSVTSRVLITGVAPISAIGIGREDFASGLREGRQGIRPIESFNPEAYDYRLAAECLDFALADFLDSEKTYLDRCSELTLAACALAFEDAGLAPGDLDPERVGLVFGTAHGPLDTLWAHTQRVQSGGLRRASSVLFLHSFVNTPISLASIEFDIRGPVACFCQGLASSGAALQFAAELIADGRADVVLAGGVDALSEVLYSALNEAGWLGNGFVPGEGAALLVLQSESSAAARGVAAQAELLSVGLATEPDDEPAALELAAERALQGAGLAAGAVRLFEPSTEYGRPFGATCALDLAAAISCGLPEEPYLVRVGDPSGLACAAIVGRA